MTTDMFPTTIEYSIRDLVRERRSIRAFRDEPVPRAVLEEILRDAMWAPSPHNSQPWRFTALFSAADKDRLAITMAARLAEELRADDVAPESIATLTARSRQRINSAPVVMLCSLVSDGLVTYPDARRNALEWEMAVQSVGSILQTIFLLAWKEGIGSCWMAAPMYCPDIVRETLQLPREYIPQALALLGYPANDGKKRERRPFHEVVELR